MSVDFAACHSHTSHGILCCASTAVNVAHGLILDVAAQLIAGVKAFA